MGFAVGDTALRTAVPITPIRRGKKEQDIHHIKKLIPEYDIDKIIIGYPLNMNGTKNKITLQVENFIKHIKKKINIETEFVDERLTSFEAEEVLKSHQPNYKKRKQILDSISALIILKSYMEIV